MSRQAARYICLRVLAREAGNLDPELLDATRAPKAPRAEPTGHVDGDEAAPPLDRHTICAISNQYAAEARAAAVDRELPYGYVPDPFNRRHR